MRLDDRWGTGYWESDSAPPVPERRCEACQRRGAWLVLGGWDEDDELDDDDEPATFLIEHPVYLCSWCEPEQEWEKPPETASELDQALARAREKSISWSWRYSRTR